MKKLLKNKSKSELIRMYDELEGKYRATLEMLNELQRIAEEKNYELITERLNHYGYVQESLPDLVNITEVDEIDEEIKEEKKRTKTKGSGRQKGSKNYSQSGFEDLPKDNEDVYPKETRCPKCGGELKDFKNQKSTKVVYVKAHLRVMNVSSHICKCPKCNKVDNKLYYPITKDMFPRSVITPSFGAYLLESKYFLGVPIEKITGNIVSNLHANINSKNVGSYLIQIANKIEPIYNRMWLDLKSEESIHADEAPVSVANKPKEDKDRKKSYMYVFSSNYYHSNKYLYAFAKTRSSKNIESLISDYSGYLTVDGYKSYNKLIQRHPNIILTRCWVHARRNFIKILEGIPEEKRKGSIAYQFSLVINELFINEDNYKKEQLGPIERHKRRQKEQKVVLNKIEKLIEEHKNFLPGSLIGKAIAYLQEYWQDLIIFMNDGQIDIENNIAERAVKPFVVARKSFQVIGSYGSGKSTAILFSIVQSAHINMLSIYDYLNHVLENIEKEPIENLLPYNQDIKNKFKSPIYKLRKTKSN